MPSCFRMRLQLLHHFLLKAVNILRTNVHLFVQDDTDEGIEFHREQVHTASVTKANICVENTKIVTKIFCSFTRLPLTGAQFHY